MLTIARLLIVVLVLSATAASAVAQFPNTGKLNTWTTRPVSRRHATDTTYVRRIRVGRHQTFDRVVFEFSGAMPNYHVGYLRSRYYEDEGGTHRIKIAGNIFMEVNLSVIPSDEEQMRYHDQQDFIPKGRQKFRSVWELEEAGLFEGYYDFLLGVSARKPFRVIELSDPLRLVIDFKN